MNIQGICINGDSAHCGGRSCRGCANTMRALIDEITQRMGSER